MYEACHGVLSLLPERLTIAVPFLGMGGVSEFFHQVEVPFESELAIDIDTRLWQYHKDLAALLEKQFPGRRHQLRAEGIRCGPTRGDLLVIDIKVLASFHAVICGPPCQPWSRGGSGGGEEDQRSRPFKQLLLILEEQARRPGEKLLFFLIEESPCLLNRVGGRSSFADAVVSRLSSSMPMFAVDTVVVDLQRFLPQRRTRCWLRGVRKDVLGRSGAGSIPAPLAHFGEGPLALADLLDHSERSLAREEVGTAQQRQNLNEYEEIVRSHLRAETAGAIAVVDLGRSTQKVFAAQVLYDRVPPLTTKGPEVFLMSTSDFGESETKARRVYRFLSESERFKLMGFPGEYSQFVGKTMSRRISGNAFAPPMLGAVLAPIARCLADSGILRQDSFAVQEPGAKPGDDNEEDLTPERKSEEGGAEGGGDQASLTVMNQCTPEKRVREDQATSGRCMKPRGDDD
jgi:site-specific DNA-cytosine methylase